MKNKNIKNINDKNLPTCNYYNNCTCRSDNKKCCYFELSKNNLLTKEDYQKRQCSDTELMLVLENEETRNFILKQNEVLRNIKSNIKAFKMFRKQFINNNKEFKNSNNKIEDYFQNDFDDFEILLENKKLLKELNQLRSLIDGIID